MAAMVFAPMPPRQLNSRAVPGRSMMMDDPSPLPSPRDAINATVVTPPPRGNVVPRPGRQLVHRDHRENDLGRSADYSLRGRISASPEGRLVASTHGSSVAGTNWPFLGIRPAMAWGPKARFSNADPAATFPGCAPLGLGVVTTASPAVTHILSVVSIFPRTPGVDRGWNDADTSVPRRRLPGPHTRYPCATSPPTTACC